MGNTKGFLLVPDTGVPWKVSLSTGGFQTGLEVKTKTDCRKHRVWSWSFHFSTKLNTPNNVLITCLPFSCPCVVWKKRSYKCPLKRKGSIVLQYHDTRNNHTWKGGNGTRKIAITFSALETVGQKMSSIEVCKSPSIASLILHVRT